MGLSYDDNGGSGTPFVFVHGWCCNRSFFAPQIEHFGRNHRTIALDLRGHGASPVADDGDYSIAAFATDVAEVIESLGLAPAVVVGHSLGGVIATRLAATRPELVAGAVLVDPAPMVITQELRPVYEGMLAAINGPDGVASRAAIVDGMFMASDDSERRAEITATMAAQPHEIAAPAISAILGWDGTAGFAAVTRPIAVINADGPMNGVAEMKAANPNVVIGQTLGVGHFNQLEAPDQVNAMIERFLLINDL